MDQFKKPYFKVNVKHNRHILSLKRNSKSIFMSVLVTGFQNINEVREFRLQGEVIKYLLHLLYLF